MKQPRETGTGRYAHDGDMDRLCTCGHRLGDHTAARVRYAGRSLQDCMYPGCACQCFKLRSSKHKE